MPKNNDPFNRSEESKDNFEYSIPKILVAVLLVLFLCQTAYVYYKNRKNAKALIYLLEKEKLNEKSIIVLTEKHNLAEDDITRLKKKLLQETKAFKEYKDSIKKRRRYYR